jgi:hypothetical protein
VIAFPVHRVNQTLAQGDYLAYQRE